MTGRHIAVFTVCMALGIVASALWTFDILVLTGADVTGLPPIACDRTSTQVVSGQELDSCTVTYSPEQHIKIFKGEIK